MLNKHNEMTQAEVVANLQAMVYAIAKEVARVRMEDETAEKQMRVRTTPTLNVRRTLTMCSMKDVLRGRRCRIEDGVPNSGRSGSYFAPSLGGSFASSPLSLSRAQLVSSSDSPP